jgi:hypothetical protein
MRCRFPRKFLLVGGLGALAACADQSVSPVHDAAVSNPAGVVAGVPAGQFWQRGQFPVAEARGGKPGGGGKKAQLLLYHNGPVLRTSKTMAILWGPQWSDGSFPSDVIPGLDQFFQGWGDSRYNGLNTEYYDNTGQITAASTYLGHMLDGSAAPTGELSVTDAVAEACKITGNNPDPLALYLIYTPTFPSNVGYCAWHSWGNCSNGAPVQVAYEPNPNGIAGCDPSDTWTSHSEMLGSLVNTSAHETAEAITDPRGTGWYDRRGYENADKCAWQFQGPVTLANGSIWKIQMNWSNASAGCQQGA